jgi:hypothetical protein
MPLDPERASFLLEEHRYSNYDDSATKLAYPQWRTLRIQTNLSTTAGGDALAAELLSTFKEPIRNFSVEIEGTTTFKLSDLDGSPPTFTPTFERFSTTGGTRLPSEITVDFASGATSLVLRG